MPLCKSKKKQDKPPKKKVPTKFVTRLMADSMGQRMILKTTLREVIIYIPFVIVSTIAFLDTDIENMNLLGSALREPLILAPFSGLNNVDMTFKDIRTADDMWRYLHHALVRLNTHLLPSSPLFSPHVNVPTYLESVTTTTEATDTNDTNITTTTTAEPRFAPRKFKDEVYFHTILLGPSRLRQLMVRNDSCEVVEIMQGYFWACYSDYNEKYLETRSFGPGKGKAFTYSPPATTYKTPGEFADYPGGGYIQDLPPDQKGQAATIKLLEDNFWVRLGTRCVLYEFTVYNVNINIFAVGKLIFEFPPTGGVRPSTKFMMAELTPRLTFWSFIRHVMFLAFYGFIVLFILEEVREMIYFRKKYFLKFWNYIDLTILVLAAVIFVLFWFNFAASTKYVKKTIDERNKYPNLESVIQVCDDQDTAQAILLFFIYVKIFKYLSVSRRLSVMNATLRKCAWEMITFLIMVSIIYFGFSIFGYMVFGRAVYEFSSIPYAMMYLFRVILGQIDYQAMVEVDWIAAPIFFSLFIFIVFFVLLNMFVAIIVDTYSNVITKNKLLMKPMEMWDYLKIYVFPKFGSKFLCKKRTKSNKIKTMRNVLLIAGYDRDQIDAFFDHYDINSKKRRFDVRDLIASMDKAPDEVTSFGRGSLEDRVDTLVVALQSITDKVATFSTKFHDLRPDNAEIAD